MENTVHTEEDEIVNLDYNLCIICQKKCNENLVENPKAQYEKVRDFIEEWARYGDLSYSESWRRLQLSTPQDLLVNQASWHRSCYKNAVHTGMLKRAKERYERQLAGPNEARRKSANDGSLLTRSKTLPFSKDVCFFCDGQPGYRQALHSVSTFTAGESLRSATSLSGNDKLSVKLSTAIDANDAHAIDIKYHKNCWVTNVTNVIRKKTSSAICASSLANEIAAKIEFLTVTEMNLKDGSIVTMNELQTSFQSTLEANNVTNPACNRKALKQLLQREIPNIEFHKPKRVNESERVSIKETRDTAIQQVEDLNKKTDTEIKTLFDAAAILRKAISNSKKWKFTGTLDNISDENLPMELYSFFRWVIQGPNKVDPAEKKFDEVHKRAMSLAQTTICMSLSERQMKNKKSEKLTLSTEMPQQLAVGLAVHQAARSKELISMLYGFGMSLDYNRILRVEAQIESSVLKRMAQNNGVYLPPDIVKGRHLFFAVDNVDFEEDTPDGKNTFHGTAMAIYQRRDPKDKEPELDVDTSDHRRSIKDLPESMSSLLECPDPHPRPMGPLYPSFGIFSADELPIQVTMQDFAWLLGRSLNRTPIDGNHMRETQSDINIGPENQPTRKTDVPVWSAYNSLIGDTMPTTRVGSPPLIAAPAHEWNTLLTVLMQAQKISVQVVGAARKTVISFDLGLYQPAKKLQMSRQDLNNIILRPGELHVVMAQLRTIGAYIENGGLDTCWVESGLYGPATVKQIINGNHVKRGETAHLITLQALFMMYQEAFFKQSDSTLYHSVEQLAKQLSNVCTNGSKAQVEDAHAKLVKAIFTMKISEKMKAFDEKQDKIPLITVMRNYMRMVMEMMVFIRAVRTGDWELHLKALEVFTKYFFAHDRLNYARMIPVYIAEMKKLHETDPDIYKEFHQGNWVVNKNDIPFCAIGADNALEHVNRSMKVSGGLIGITLNSFARSKYFLIAPELAKLAEQAKSMAGTSTKKQRHHHSHTAAVLSRQERNIEQLEKTIRGFTNPFLEESDDLFNLATKVVVPENVKNDMCQQSDIGQKLFSDFVKKRIQSGDFSIWSPMKKRKLLTWKSTGKAIKVKAQDKTIELKEDRTLFARMMIICKTRPEIDIKEAVGQYEFSVVPRSMFAADGTMLHCSSKSTLMEILEKLVVQQQMQQVPTGTIATHMKISIVDAMAEVQALNKPVWIKNCSHLAEHFTSRIFEKYNSSDELRLIFDRYDVPLSLKTATRMSRQGGQDPIYYKISDTTQIAKTPMKRLLSHVKTKMELTEYLAGKTLERGEESGLRVVVAWGSQCKATHKDMVYLSSNQEEADTKILLHAIDATVSGATSIEINSPDTDVFVLALRRFPELCEDTKFVTGRGQHHREIPLGPIVRSLGSAKTAALPGFHAWSGADVTGSFAGKGKLGCWKAFIEADEDIIDGLTDLGASLMPIPRTVAAIEKFVCKLFQPKTRITQVKELRWQLFKRKQAEAERLPPTQAALKEAIMRAHYQAMVWNHDKVPNPELPSPENYGWSLETDVWVPVMTRLPPAPTAVIYLVKCGCKKEKCLTNRCNCRKSGLRCTDICGCNDDGDELCHNTTEIDEIPQSSSDEDDDDDDEDDNDD